MRWHLFEWMDQPWLPRPLRDAMRHYLAASYAMTPLPALWATPLASLLRDTKQTRLVDLGSGASGPVRLVLDALRAHGVNASATLTDLYPVDMTTDADARLRPWPTPVDARAVPASLHGVRTMFAVFHHLRPADAARVLRDAFTQRQSIAVFEGTARTPAAIAVSLLIPLLVLVMTPRIRPLSAFQLVFTYLIPVLPILIFWDGLVSQVRTYSPAELGALIADLQDPTYHWEIGTLSAPGVPFSVPYLVGRPTPRPA